MPIRLSIAAPRGGEEKNGGWEWSRDNGQQIEGEEKNRKKREKRREHIKNEKRELEKRNRRW